MSFDTTAGTRGGRQPAGFAARLSNKVIAGRVRKGGAKFLGFNALVLTTVGRKTGAERTTPVGWFPGPDGSWLIVASAAGAAGNPAWYYNLAAHPDQVQIEVEGRKVPVTAEQLHGTEPGAGLAADRYRRAPVRQVPAEDRPGTADHPPGWVPNLTSGHHPLWPSR